MRWTHAALGRRDGLLKADVARNLVCGVATDFSPEDHDSHEGPKSGSINSPRITSAQ
jgi:hypothetical protein